MIWSVFKCQDFGFHKHYSPLNIFVFIEMPLGFTRDELLQNKDSQCSLLNVTFIADIFHQRYKNKLCDLKNLAHFTSWKIQMNNCHFSDITQHLKKTITKL